MKATITGDLKKIKLSPARFKYKGVDLGYCVNGADIEIKDKKAEIKADAFGDIAVNRVNVGVELTAVVKLAQLTVDSIKAAWPYSQIVGTGPTKAVIFGNKVGDNDLDLAGLLNVHPLNKIDADLSDDWTFWLAVAVGEGKLTYDAKNQITLEVKINIYPDTTKPESYMFGIYGDPATGVVAATGGPATFLGTGNGTLTGIGVNNNTTKTETWTATCIKAVTNGGIFEVIGSVSGARGNARVGSVFYSNPTNPGASELQFTINDGLIDFAEGDAFTIPTVAANYA